MVYLTKDTQNRQLFLPNISNDLVKVGGSHK